MRAFWLAGMALALASGAQAGELAELDCMAKSYTTDQSREIDRLLPAVDMLAAGENPEMNALGMLVGSAAMECASSFEWDDAEFEPAVFFELGRLMEQAVRRHGPLPREDVARIDQALAKGDRAALWRALEEQVALGVAGQPDSISNANAMVLGAFMLEIGAGLDEAKGEQVGVLLATMAMQRSSRRAFAGQ